MKEKRKWRWKGKRIEEVKEFQYLFFLVSRGKYLTHFLPPSGEEGGDMPG